MSDSDARDKFATAAMTMILSRPPRMKKMKPEEEQKLNEEINQLAEQRLKAHRARAPMPPAQFSHIPEIEELGPAEVAREAWEIADAMMREREKRQ